MRALTYEGPREIAVSEVADPTPMGLDGAVVRVALCGICGSDLHIYDGHGFSADLGFCVGHEAVGEVVEVGSAVRGFRVGDRVLVPASTGCGQCGPCRTGHVAACERGMAGCYGLGARLPGSQAEAVAVPAADHNLVTIPDAIGDEAALMLTDNLPTAWYGVRRARIAPGDTVAVVGLGPVGLLAVASALVLGAGAVYAVDLVADRRARAAALGAIPVDGDPRAVVREATRGRGADCVIEAVGADATVQLALDLAGRGGRVSVIGVSQSNAFPLHLQKLQFFEGELHAGLCSVQYELDALLALVANGRLDPSVVISHRMGLSEGPEAYRRFAARSDDVAKIVLDPTR
mgnify:CR=1 FL=1